MPGPKAQPAPDRFARPLFIEGPMSERELRVAYAKHVLIECDGNKSLAAKVLGISRKAVYRRLEMLLKGGS